MWLYYCHRVSTQMQLTNISYIIRVSYRSIHHISYRILSYRIIYHIISYRIVYHIIYIISYRIYRIISYRIIYHIISYRIISYNISYYIVSYRIISYIIYRTISYVISYYIIYRLWHLTEFKFSWLVQKIRW